MCLSIPIYGVFWRYLSAVYISCFFSFMDFPGGSEVKESACNAGAWVRPLGWEDPLEKEMATHSSILAWRIPWMEEPGGLQSMGSQRIGHDWVTSLSLSSHPWCLCFIIFYYVLAIIQKMICIIIWSLWWKCLPLHRICFYFLHVWDYHKLRIMLKVPWKVNQSAMQAAVTCEDSYTYGSHLPWDVVLWGLSLFWGGPTITS